jgi:hypothetical protein
MNKSILLPAVVLVILGLGAWLWFGQQSDDIVLVPSTTQSVTEVATTRVYREANIGFSITLPTILSSTTSDTLYHVDESYKYTVMGEGKAILGVKFTIPQAMNVGTNLSSDSYLSVEHMDKEQICEATAFLGDSKLKSQTIIDGAMSYSYASSSEAAAGNRYEEYVYAFPSSDSCLAVRYFIHYGAIENYDQDKIKAFNKVKLIATFDSIRKSLILK